MNERQRESGLVAIFTVIFFTLLVSVLTVGYLRVMVDEGSQATDNDLTTTAYNAARAGIEDGKRIISYCATVPASSPDRALCDASLAATNCRPGAMSDAMAAKLGVSRDSTTGNVRVSSQTGFEEHYNCLTIQTKTANITGKVGAFQSKLIPLNSTAPFQDITLQWHGTAADKQGMPIRFPASPSELPSQTAWNATSPKTPAYIRLQYFEHGINNIDFAAMDSSSRTTFLVPVGAGGTLVNMGTDDSRTGARVKLLPRTADCINSPTMPNPPTYACSLTVRLPSLVDPASKKAYLQITALYNETNYLITPQGGAMFDGVQPVIDATGRSNDVFRRLQARVEISPPSDAPPYTVETGSGLCKSFSVGLVSAAFSDSDGCLLP